MRKTIFSVWLLSLLVLLSLGQDRVARRPIYPSGAPAGYDVFLGAGQSNKFYGATFDAMLDVSASTIHQLYNGGLGTAGTLSAGNANDPLDEPDTANQTPPNTYIGHDVHFLVDYYIPNGLLLSPRELIIVPYAYGGSVVNSQSQWGANTGSLTACTTSASSLIELSVTRTNQALAQTGTNSLKAILWHQGEGDYEPFGNTLQLGVAYKYRWQLLRTFSYLRQNLGANVPIVAGRLTEYSIDASFANYSKNGVIFDGMIQAIANRVKYSGVANSQSPTALGASNVHFTAAEQRTMAGRYYTAYQAALTNTLATGTTWDALDYPQSSLGYAAGYTLTNSNRDASGDANDGWKTLWATNPKTTGKWYAEFKVIAVNNNAFLGFIGFSNSDKAWNNYLGVSSAEDGPSVKSAGMYDSNGQAVQGFTQVWTGNQGNRAANDIIMLALDIPNGKAWIGKNGTWSNSGDPVAGTNPWVTGLVDGEMLFLSASIYGGTGNTWRLQTSAAQQTHSAPSGYSSWDQ